MRALSEKNSPYGYRYSLGWSIAGPLTVRKRRETVVNFISIGRQPDDLIERFWKIEDYGTARAVGKPLSVEDKRALQIIRDTTTFVDGHYEIGLLWKCDNPQLPNNRSLADKRAESLRRRLSKKENGVCGTSYSSCEIANTGFVEGQSELGRTTGQPLSRQMEVVECSATISIRVAYPTKLLPAGNKILRMSNAAPHLLRRF